MENQIVITKYFNWLQKDNPTGLVEKYPQLDKDKQTTLKGVYVVGDLTGIPLLKLAADSGARMVQFFDYDKSFIDSKGQNTDVYDVVIVGGGPAGISAAIECTKRKLKYKILEASQLFNTIENFPKGKPIIASPDELDTASALDIHDGTKESLLDEMKSDIAKYNLDVETGCFVQKISRKENTIELETPKGNFKALRVILGIGKSGNARKLGVEGEDLEKVFNKLYDPAEFTNKDILVVGGGDSALESSIALAESGNHVTHSYRKGEFARPKEENANKFNALVEQGKITPLWSSQVKKVSAGQVELTQGKETKAIDNDLVFTLIGRELPLQFFKRSGILMEGEKGRDYWVFLTAMLSFFTMLYFGKSGGAINLDEGTAVEKTLNFLKAPLNVSYGWQIQGGAWYTSLNFLLGWLGSIVFTISGLTSLFYMFKKREKYFSIGWPLLKYSYLIIAALAFCFVYIKSIYFNPGGKATWVEGPTYFYSLLYCTTMAFFAVRRAMVKKTRYIKLQMACLVSIQVFFLFLLPFHLYEPFIEPFKESLWVKEMFPNGKWNSFGFILFWPLNMGDFGTSRFWTIYPFVQTFGFLFLLVKYYGKGAYCGWICSCGGMAETLGDEYRDKAPHGPTAKKWENLGQGVLAFAVVMTIVTYFAKGSVSSDLIKYIYKLLIDVFFAGVLGLGVYFFMGGRVWCRFGCPLAALMHIYTRVSKYRILSEKKKCISCNICTKVCHMGIDVMNYANKGIPMNDAECVRCSTCVTSCPMDVLSFGQVEVDADNKSRESVPEYGKDDWRAGIK